MMKIYKSPCKNDDYRTIGKQPMFKKGSRSENRGTTDRPISITLILCKMLESIMRDKMLKYAEENKFMTTEQHGFTNERSCLTNLLETLEDWTEALDNGYGLDILYLDYKKAFDNGYVRYTVSHKRLC